VTIRTAQGNVVETLEYRGRTTPFRHGEFVVLRVAVDGRPYPSWQIPSMTWDQEAGTMDADSFWQNVADYALTMGDVNAALQI
jgi:hypothetical protein